VVTDAGTGDHEAGVAWAYGVSFFGPNAVAAYADVFGLNPFFTTAVPLEDTGGTGTQFQHWREAVFAQELMTGYLDNTDQPLSKITAASLRDIGYVVDLGASDPYIPDPVFASAAIAISTPASDVLAPVPIALNTPGFRADFGTDTSPTASHFAQVTPATVYDPATGYGWLPGDSVSASDVGPVPGFSDLTRDINTSKAATFVVDLPNGVYDVTVTVGDPLHDHNQMEIVVEGELRGNISSVRGSGISNTYRVVVADHQFTLALRSSTEVAISALQVSQVALGDFPVPAERSGRFAFAIQDLNTGFIMREIRNTAIGVPLCIDGVFLSANTPYRQWVLDLNTLEAGASDFSTPPSGQEFEMPRIILSPTAEPDIDGDGLDRVVEFILGTDPAKSDTDGDGINDLGEIKAGGDPLGGRALPTGIVANLPLQGQAKSVTLEGSTASAETQTAYIATGSYGLAIVEASDFQRPLVLGQIDLTGDAVDVAVDSRLGMAAVAAGSALHLVDVSDATTPVRTQTVNIPAAQVEATNGVAYAAANYGIEAYSLLTGELLQVLPLGSANVTALARDGGTLYALDAAGTLRAIEISGLSMSCWAASPCPPRTAGSSPATASPTSAQAMATPGGSSLLTSPTPRR
jgi:hypothetical protein